MKSDLKIGGVFENLHEGNHGKNGNPHDQYVQKLSVNQIPQVGDSGSKWCKVGTVISTESTYGFYYVGEIEAIGGNIGAPYTQYGKFKLSIRSKSDGTLESTLKYNTDNFEIMTKDDIKIIVSTNNVNGANVLRLIDVYVKVYYGWDDIRFRINYENYYRSEFIWDCKTLVTTVPTSLTITTNVKEETKLTLLQPALMNGYTTEGSQGTLTFTKNRQGLIVIRGGVVPPSGVVTGGQQICATLPTDFRPIDNTTITFNAFTYVNGYTPTVTSFKLQSDGIFKPEVVLPQTNSTVTYISFGMLSYYTKI